MISVMNRTIKFMTQSDYNEHAEEEKKHVASQSFRPSEPLCKPHILQFYSESDPCE